MIACSRIAAVQQTESCEAKVKKRLILHIGMHKTGTSSVQRYFSRNRAILRRMGVCYPKSIGREGERQPKHAAIFDAISHEADFGVHHPVLGPSADQINLAATEIEAAPGDLGIISAEGLSGERPVFAAALANLAARFDTTVVVFVRRQDHWVESFYKQMVLSRDVRETRSFHEFVEAASTRRHMDFARIIDWWRAEFEDVRVLGFHPEGPARPLRRLLEIAQLGRPFHWLPFANAHENPSPGVEAVEMIRRSNQKGLVAPRDAAARIEEKLGKSDVRYFTQEERVNLLRSVETGNLKLSNLMETRDHSCIRPNMAQLGRSRELHWTGDISAQISPHFIDGIQVKPW